ARDAKNRPVTDLMIRGGITAPGAKPDDAQKVQLKFEQENSGLYKATFKAEEAGSYFVNAQATRKVTETVNGKEVTRDEVDSVRAGVTIPYSPEFADNESNTGLLEKLRLITDGKTYSEDLLAKAANPKDPETESTKSLLAGNVFRSGLPQFRNLQPIWY